MLRSIKSNNKNESNLIIYIHIFKNMNLLIATTLPHLLCILPIIKYFLYKEIFWYINIIVITTVFSVLSHKIIYKNNQFIIFIDYLFSFIWIIYDIYLGCLISKNVLIKIIISNLISFIFNKKIDQTGYYYFFHSLWNIINAFKPLEI